MVLTDYVWTKRKKISELNSKSLDNISIIVQR